MSDYHILSADISGNKHRVAMHFPVNDTTNQVDYSYRDAIVEWQGDTISVVPFIEPTEQAQLDNGELYERVYPFDSNPGETLVDKRTRLDTIYAANLSAVQTEVQNRLGFWGYSRNVS